MNFKYSLLPVGVCLAIPSSFTTLGTSLNDEIVMATYQSYIDEDIASSALDEFGIKTTYFENDKEVLSNFQLGAYDFAVMSSSTLEEAIKKNLVKKIDWSKFTSIGQKYKNGGSAQAAASSSSSNSNSSSSTSYQLMQVSGPATTSTTGYNFNDKLFSPIVNKFFQDKSELKEYGVPYFLSYLVFAYRGEKLNLNSAGTGVGAQASAPGSAGTSSQPQSWKDLIKKLLECSRFKSSEGPKLGLIDDELTMHSLAKLGSCNNGNCKSLFGQNSNGSNGQQSSSSHTFDSKYSQLESAGLSANKLGSRSVFLNPDSALMSEMLSTQAVEGAFLYNGDAYYSYYMVKEEQSDEEESGAPGVPASGPGEQCSSSDSSDSSDSSSKEDPETKYKFHILEGAPSLWLLDSIALNARVSPEKEEKIYKFLDKLLFQDALKEVTAAGSQASATPKTEQQAKRNPKLYSSWAWQNFDFLQYTPVLKDMWDIIKQCKEGSNGEAQEGQEGQEESTPKPCEKGGDELKKVSEEEEEEDDKKVSFDSLEIKLLFGEYGDKCSCTEKKRDQENQGDQVNQGDQKNQSEGQCNIVFEGALTEDQNLRLALDYQQWKSRL
ncbi:spermidine/putrescine ABC transporter substrate-binding protein [Candidatus Mycoplasma haematolamae str. Purdue]|uniref:Spermidine/putrescine ABC transporter substrate-binding protein n=1 Tax=Mycoplasma haematolamae (strain Purdue) TaxID=1212765 RepID=I7CEG6_MYCHA|nr:spermidine/putrescine ABC transporter substrate-binding protein [Candidatus Mycoplasma haematolamae]AFO51626.1 spermidine/putrescine ABC transporter substrate-binding protein [Candidatus Mycoplasma haematolamae str. Purdue]